MPNFIQRFPEQYSMPGYNIECDQGSLYYRKCYVVLASGEKQEIIGYTAGGDPISKDSTDVPTGTAWVPTMTTLDMYGDAYQPYPEGIPYTAGGGSVVNWTPSGGADVSNIYTYLNQSMPGAYARQMEKDRTCNPLWPTFGCKTYTEDSVPIGTTGGTATTGNADDETPSLWESFTSWWSGSAENFNSLWVGDTNEQATGGKMKFRKGKTDDGNTNQTAGQGSGGFGPGHGRSPSISGGSGGSRLSTPSRGIEGISGVGISDVAYCRGSGCIQSPEGADWGQPLDAGGDSLGSNFGQDQGKQATMAADEEMQVIEQDIPGNYIEPQTNIGWNRLAVPAIVLGGLSLALWQDKRMNRGAKDGWY